MADGASGKTKVILVWRGEMQVHAFESLRAAQCFAADVAAARYPEISIEVAS